MLEDSSLILIIAVNACTTVLERILVYKQRQSKYLKEIEYFKRY